VALVQALASADLDGHTDRDLLERFIINDDHTAFAGLVSRHTEMVLQVCRRVLPHAQDQEDVCQAVFLLLAEKAARQEEWAAAHPDLPSLAAQVRQLSDEIEHLHALLREHGIEPEPGAA